MISSFHPPPVMILYFFYFEFSMRYLRYDRTRLEELSCFRDHADYSEKIPFERLILFLKGSKKNTFRKTLTIKKISKRQNLKFTFM